MTLEQQRTYYTDLLTLEDQALYRRNKDSGKSHQEAMQIVRDQRKPIEERLAEYDRDPAAYRRKTGH